MWGGVNYAKGEQLIVNLAQTCFMEDINLKISIIGSLSEGNYFNINHLGDYKRDDLSKILENSKTDLFFIPSITEETYSFVADEIALNGFPLAIFPIGAPYERLGNLENVKVIPLTYGLDLVNELYKVAL